MGTIDEYVGTYIGPFSSFSSCSNICSEGNWCENEGARFKLNYAVCTFMDLLRFRFRFYSFATSFFTTSVGSHEKIPSKVPTDQEAIVNYSIGGLSYFVGSRVKISVSYRFNNLC